MSRALALAFAAAAVALALAAAGCGGSKSDEEQVRDTVTELARATEAKDYQALCDRILAPKLIEEVRRVGLPCEVALQQALGEVKEPRLTIGRITVDGERAKAEVRTSAEGQKPSQDVVELQRVDENWRISALAG
jgi:hypothetical protein